MKKYFYCLLVLLLCTKVFAAADEYVPLDEQPFIGNFECQGHDLYFKEHYTAKLTISVDPKNSNNLILKWTYPNDKQPGYSSGFIFRGRLITIFQNDNLTAPGASHYIASSGGQRLKGTYIYFNNQNNNPSTINCWKKS